MNSLPVWLGSILSALMIIAIFAFSDRFSRYGLAGWKTALFGMVLVFLAFISRAVMSLPNFAELFVPGTPEFVAQISDIVVVIGAVVVAMAVFVAVRRLAITQDSEQKRESQLQFLDNLKNIIFEPYSLVEVLNFSLNEISQTLDDCSSAIFIFNASRRELYLTSSVKLDQTLESTLERITLGNDIFSRTQKTSRSHAVGRLSQSDKATQSLFGGGQVDSVLAAPLMSRNGCVGVVAIFSDLPYQFTRRESEMVNSAANLLGPVVASFRMEREIRKLNERIAVSAEERSSLFSVISSLNGKMSASDNLGILLEYAESVLQSDGLVLAESAGDSVWKITKATDDSPFDGDIPRDFSRHLDNAVKNRKPLMIKTGARDRRESSRFLIFPIETPADLRAVLVASVSTGHDTFSQDQIAAMQLQLKLVGMLLSRTSVMIDEDSSVMAGAASAFRLLMAASTASQLGEAAGSAVAALMQEYDAGMMLAYEDGKNYLRFVSSFGYQGMRTSGHRLDSSKGPWGKLKADVTDMLLTERRQIEDVFLTLAGDDLAWFMERSDEKRLPEYCRVVQLFCGEERIGCLYLEGSDELPSEQSGSSHEQVLFDLIGFRMREMLIAGAGGDVFGALQAREAGDSLNQVNNILTGIIGKAQLLSFGLNSEEFQDKGGVLRNLDLVADEAFQAGELIKQIQLSMREETSHEEKQTRPDLANVLQKVAITRYGGDPNLHYLREDPSVVFEAVLEPGHDVNGVDRELEELVAEAIQFVWDEFDIDDKAYVEIRDKKSHCYILISDRAVQDDWVDPERMTFRKVGLHPQLSQLGSVADPLELPVAFCEQRLEDGSRVLCLRFDRDSQVRKTASESFDILAIDDQEIIRELLTGMLEQLGYNVTVCSSGTAGIEAFERDEYDLVITDIGLPDIDGWQVAETIKRRDPNIPIIMITGWGLGRETERANRLGIEHILPKPFRLENLSELIEDIRSRRASA